MKALSPTPRPPLEHYLNLKFPIEIVEDDGAWVASVPDLPGCNSFGNTITEAVENVQKAKALWIQSQYQLEANIPEPTDEEDFSGRFVLRIPKLLHRSLAYEARKQGVSLNHYASHLLSQRQPLEALERLSQSLFDICSAWKTPGFYGRHWQDKTLMIGKSTNAELLILLRRPPAHGAFKFPVPGDVRKQYALPEPR